MGKVDPQAVMALRQLTDLPLSACREALVAAGGDVSAAIVQLRLAPCGGIHATEAQRTGGRTRPIEVEVRASLVINPRDENIIAEWDIEQLRHLVFDICEASAEVALPGGLRATVRFVIPSPFDLKEAELRRG